MKLFFDQNLSFKLCERLGNLYPGSTQARLEGLDRASDREIWAFAAAHGFLIVSQDSDFAEMAAYHGPPPKVLWLRGGNRQTAATEQTLRRFSVAIEKFAAAAMTACMEIY